jgi:hypothetical protein
MFKWFMTGVFGMIIGVSLGTILMERKEEEGVLIESILLLNVFF